MLYHPTKEMLNGTSLTVQFFIGVVGLTKPLQVLLLRPVWTHQIWNTVPQLQMRKSSLHVSNIILTVPIRAVVDAMLVIFVNL
jgi:hypothetical protein